MVKQAGGAVVVADVATGSGEHDSLFRGFAQAIEKHLGGTVDEKRVCEIVDEKIEARVPRPIEVNLGNGVTRKIEGRVHKGFDELVDLVNEGHHNVLMVGPAGSGKTTLAKNLADALGKPFGFLSLSAGVTETHLFGRLLPQANGSWDYVASRFVEIYEGGGIFLLDEIDAADANVLVAINAALANGVMANPNGRVHVRHPDCYILGAANTWGQGGDLMYVGRNQLDTATLDRFVLAQIVVDYDAALEADLASSLDHNAAGGLLQWIGNVRASIRQNRLRRVASTRLVVHAIAALRSGKTLADVQARYFINWSADERAKVEAA